MEKWELTQLEELAPEHPELQKLWQKHLGFEKKLIKLERKGFRTPEEELEIRELKKQKLEGKTSMVQFINKYAKKDG